MKQTQKKPKYFLYARKSTDTEDLQVLSIDSQIYELQKIADHESLDVIEILSESRSAKTLGRPVFNSMLDRISKGEASGILSWKLDRLARNFIDGGKVIEMIQTGTVQHIRTFDRNYYPQDNVLLMSVEFGMANQYSRDLALNVARGMRTKAEMGWYPVQPPLGYLNTKTNEKGSERILSDQERFALVRKMWDLMLTGAYTPSVILQIATDQWGLRSRSGKRFSLSNVYKIFSNSFYYGMYEFPAGSGLWYKGRHEPMVTIEEFDKVQILLGRKGRPRPKSHIFAFIGSMHCGVCGMAVTAHEKKKVQKNGNVHHYVYYHCTRRGKVKCTQGVLPEGELMSQVLARLGDLEIPQPFHQWAVKWLEKENSKEVLSKEKVLANQRSAYDTVVRKLDRLIDMRSNGELSEEEFRQKKSETLKEKERLNELLGGAEGSATNWTANMHSAFQFVAEAKEKFQKGPPEQKRSIFLALGSKPSLKDRKVFIDLEETLLPIKKLASEVQAIHDRFEPPENALNQGDLEETYAKNSLVCSR